MRHFGDLDLATLSHEGDTVYFSVVPGLMVRYPSALALPLAAVVAVLLLGALAFGFRCRRLSQGGDVTGGGVAVAAGTYVLAMIVTTLVVTLVWAAAKALDSDFRVFLTGHYPAALLLPVSRRWQLPCWLRRSGVLRKWIDTVNLTAGALIVWVVLMGSRSVLLPDVSFLFTWPGLPFRRSSRSKHECSATIEPASASANLGRSRAMQIR